MKTHNLSSDLNKELFSLTAIRKLIWQYLIRTLANSNEVQVWRKTDSYGNTYWQAFDPKTGRSTSLSSEDEMRIWIEQLYYHNTPDSFLHCRN